MTSRQLDEHGPNPMRRIMALTVVCGVGVLFVSGVLVGRLTEPAPGMLGGVMPLVWVVPASVVGAVLLSLSLCHRAGRSTGRLRAQTSTPAGPIARPSETGSPLDLFSTERAVNP